MTIPTAAELIQFLFDELEDYETPLVCLFGPGDLDEKGDPKGWAAKRFHPRLQWQGKASYISVGVFDVRLFEDDTPRAARANVTRCALLMLDDVGTKVPLSVLDRAPPTVLIETSAGNHQAQYKLHPKPAPDHFSAAVNALARLGLTDAGAKNATRWCRLPGSVNLKPGRGGFEAKVREWCEDNVWPLEELLEALGVELLEEDWVGAQYSGAPLRLGAPSADPVLQWLSDSGLLLRETGRDYWDIVCPNAEAHTDGNPAAGYDPAGGRFKCLHGHCTEITTAEFFSWVERQGGPAGRIGGGHEVLTEALGRLVERCGEVEVGLFAPRLAAAAQVERVGERETARQECARLLDEWFLMEKDELMWCATSQAAPISKAAFSDKFHQLPTKLPHPTQVNADGSPKMVKVAAYKWFVAKRNPDYNDIAGLTYAAGQSIIYLDNHTKLRWGNLWRDHRVAGVAGDTSVWHALLRRMIPDDRIRRHILGWMAWKLQNPGAKCNHQWLMSGGQGIGKDTVIEPFLYAISGVSGIEGRKRPNVSLCLPQDMERQWGDHLLAEIVMVPELKEQSSRGKKELANKMKPYWVGGDPIKVEMKGQTPYYIHNTAAWVIFSNFQDAISLEEDDRRLVVVWSDMPKLSPAEYASIWAWYGNGGNDAVAHELLTMDVAWFSPKEAPPETEAKDRLREFGRSDCERAVTGMIEARMFPFHIEIVAPGKKESEDAIRIYLRELGVKLYPTDVAAALKKAGWFDCGRCELWVPETGKKVKRVIYVAPSVDLSKMSKSDLVRVTEKITPQIKDLRELLVGAVSSGNP